MADEESRAKAAMRRRAARKAGRISAAKRAQRRILAYARQMATV